MMGDAERKKDRTKRGEKQKKISEKWTERKATKFFHGKSTKGNLWEKQAKNKWERKEKKAWKLFYVDVSGSDGGGDDDAL